jgi:hypothetical protein
MAVCHILSYNMIISLNYRTFVDRDEFFNILNKYILYNNIKICSYVCAFMCLSIWCIIAIFISYLSHTYIILFARNQT